LRPQGGDRARLARSKALPGRRNADAQSVGAPFARARDSGRPPNFTIMTPSFRADKSPRCDGVWDEEVTISPFEKEADALASGPVLVVEDERDLAEEIRLELEASGHSAQVLETVDDAVRAARLGASVLVIDRMLHGEDGLSIIETLRREGNATPALVISALSSVDERINGLKAGGDDYLVKPFDIRELTARVEALLRRGRDARVTRLQVGALDMDLVERTARCDGNAVDLLPREFTLLEYFMRRPGQIVTRAMLLEDVWNFKFMAPTNVVDVQIGNLRRKLDPAGARRLIVNIRAVGFKLNADA
jgi:two-component system, OmpR family, response regulator